MQLVSVRFKGAGFMNWSRGITRALIAKNKYGFVNGDITKPAENSASLQKWIRCDYMVSSWILNSMEDDIVACFGYATSSKVLWDDIKERFGENNGTLYFELGKELYNTQQGNMSIADYFGKMKRIWEDIQDIGGFPNCTCGAIKACSCSLLKKVLDADNKRKLVRFFMGVNLAYEAISQTLLTMDPLPTINQAFARLVQAERQRKIAGLTYAAEEVNALIVTKNAHQFYTFNIHQTEENSRGPKKEYRDVKRTKVPFCRYCKKEGHEIDFCYKLKNRQKRNEVPGNHNNFNKFASHVEGEKVQDHSGGLPHIDDNFLLAVAQKIIQLQHSQQFGESTSTVHLSNFEGPFN